MLVHRAGIVAGLPLIDRQVLCDLPVRARSHLAQLTETGLWADDGVIAISEVLAALIPACPGRAGQALAHRTGCVTPSSTAAQSTSTLTAGYGCWTWRWCSTDRLLDLASWPGTTGDPYPARVAALIDAYAEAGGDGRVGMRR